SLSEKRRFSDLERIVRTIDLSGDLRFDHDGHGVEPGIPTGLGERAAERPQHQNVRTCLLPEFAYRRRTKGLPPFDGATGERPSPGVGAPHEQDLSARIPREHHQSCYRSAQEMSEDLLHEFPEPARQSHVAAEDA